MSFLNNNPDIYEEFSRKYKFSIKVLNSIKEMAALKDKYPDSKNSYSSSLPKSHKNFRINFNKFLTKTKKIQEFPTLALNQAGPQTKHNKAISLPPFSQTFSENFGKKTLKGMDNEENMANETIFQTENFDQKMGEPFISIKVAGLKNYKEEPLKQYDLQTLHDFDMEELVKSGYIDAYSRWIDNDGSITWKLCLIKSFDPDKQLFHIQWKHNNREKNVTRLNLMLKSENLALFEERRALANNMRYKLLYLETYKKNIKECFEKLDYILYSIPQLKNIFEKVFTSENKFEAFNDNDELIEVLDEIFDDFKYETLRFILEWKNTNGNIKEMMRIREVPCLKQLNPNKLLKCLKNSTIIIDTYEGAEEEENLNLHINQKVEYERKYEKIEKKTKIFAYGFPHPLKKEYNLNENYYKLAQKSIKSIKQKPRKLFSVDIPLIISIIKSLENLNLFDSLKSLTFNKKLLTLEEFFKFKDEAAKAVYQIDKIFYSIEKIIEDIDDDLYKEKNITPEKKTLLIERVKKTVKIMINSSLFQTINNSLTYLAEFFDKYNAVLPFAKISPKLAGLLPNQIYEKRLFYRRKYLLPQDDVEINENTTFYENEKKYEEILLSVLEELYEGLNTNLFHTTAHLKINLMTIPPFLSLDIKLNESIIASLKKTTKEQREEHRKENRNFLKSKFENLVKKKIQKPKFTVDQNEKDELDIPKVSTQFEKEFRLDAMIFKIEPSINELETFLRDFITSPLFKIKELKKYSLLGFGKKDDYNYLQRLQEFFIEINSLFRYEFFPLISLLLIFSSFEYLVLQKKTLLQDLTEFEQINKNFNTYTDEILNLTKDKDFLVNVPHVIRVGVFNVSLEKVKSLLIENCEHLLTQLKTTLIDKFVKIVQKTEETVSNMIIRLETQPNTIDEFLEIKEFIKGQELINTKNEIMENIEKINKLVDVIEENMIDYNAEIFHVSFIGRVVWVKNLDKKIIESEKMLENSRTKFLSILEKQKKEIMLEFEIIKNDIDSFKYYYDIAECFRYNSNAKNIMSKLTGLLDNIKQMNKYETILQYPITNLKVVDDAYADFEKYYLLWEFIAEKWKYRSENWMKSPFEILDEKEMAETINEGFDLLQSLEVKMKENSYILDVIKNVIAEVNKFSGHLGVVVLLKEESFRERHWQLLWNELYVNVTNKPDHKTITLERLLQDKLMNFTSTIYKLSNSAKMEFKIEADINKIEESLKAIIIKQGIYEVGDIYPFYIIKDIEFIMNNLNTQYSICRNMLSNSEYPEEFMVRLNSLEIMINETRKCFKLMHKIQNLIMKMNPIMKLKDLDKILIKDVYFPFNKQLEEYKKRMEDINKKNMSYFLTNLIVESSNNNNSNLNLNIEKDEQFQKQYKDIYEALFSLDEHLKDLNRYVRNMNPKLYFLSDVCLMEIYSYLNDEPIKALNLIKYCYETIESFIFKEKNGDSPTKNPEKPSFIELIGFKNHSNECYYFDKPFNIMEKQTNSLDILGYIMKYLDEIPLVIKKNFMSFFINSVNNGLFNWTNFCKSLLNGQEKYQIVYLYMEICFYHNVAISLEMEDINKEMVLHNFSKKQYLLADISDEETIRLHKLKFYYDKICKFFQELLGPKKFNEEFKNNQQNILKYNQFLLEILKYKDILEMLINNNVNEVNNFHYLSLPKLSMSFEKDFIERNMIKPQESIESTVKKVKNYYERIGENSFFMESDSDYIKLGTKGEFDLCLMAMNYKLSYGFQPMILTENWVYLPQTSTYIVSLMGNLATASSSLVSGAGKIGKQAILKIMASLLGKSYFVLECSPEIAYSTLTQLLCGVASTGIWLVMSNMGDLKLDILSSFSQNIFDMRKSAYLKNDTCTISTASIKLHPNWNIFSTFTNPLHSFPQENNNFDRLPKKLLETFRVLNYTTPSYIYIIRGYLLSLGIENYIVLAKKILLFFDIISTNMGNKLFLLKEDIEKTDLKGLGCESILMRINVSHICQILMKAQKTIICRNIELDLYEYEIIKEIKRFLKVMVGDIHKEEVLAIIEAVFGRVKGENIEKNKEITKKFKESFMKYIRLKGIVYSKKFEYYCKILYEIIDNGNTLFVCGKVGISKTSIIKAVSFIYSALKEKVFSIHVMNLDALNHSHLMQNEKMKGLLDQLFLKCLIEGEKKELFDFTTLNYSSDGIDKEDIQFTNSDWLIFDQEYTEEKVKKLNFSEKLSLMFSNRKYFLDGMTCILPDTMKFIFEVNTFAEFSPNSICKCPMFYIQDQSFSLIDEFKIWKKRIFLRQVYFQKYNALLNKLFIKIYLPVHAYLLTLKKQKELTYYISKKFLLFNFLTFLDIFLNEERKLSISYNQIPPSEISRLKKSQNTTIIPTKKRHGYHPQNFDEKYNREKFNFLIEFMKSKVPIPQSVLDMREICQKFNRKPIYSSIESHFIFSMIWSNCCFVNESYRGAMGDFLIDLLGKFSSENNIDKTIFANGLLESMENKKYSYLDHFYDMHEMRWILWKDTKLPDYPIISNNYHANLEYAEMVRLNPLIADLGVLKKFMAEKEMQMTALPNLEEKQFVMNDITKKAKYFLDYLLGYNKFFLITSNMQAGKTTVIRYKIKKMLEQNICKVISLSLTGNTEAETLSHLIELKLIKKTKGVYTAGSIVKSYIFIDDLNLIDGNNPIVGMLRTIQEHGGWYSYMQKSYFRIENMALFGAYSFMQESNIDPFHSKINTMGKSILQKFTIYNMDDLNNKNLMTIFNNLNENLFEDHISEPFEYLLAKTFGQQIIKAKVLFHRISKVYEVNTTLNQIFSIIKSLQLFEWSEINSNSEIAKTFLYCINNGIGDCFLANKMEGLFEDFMTKDTSKQENSDSEADGEDNEEQESSSSSEEIIENNNENVLKPKKSTKNANNNKNNPSIIINDKKEDIEELLQSPIGHDIRASLSKKMVSFSSYKKSLQNDDFSSSEQEDSEEQADLVGELPNKYTENDIISPKLVNIEDIIENSKDETIETINNGIPTPISPVPNLRKAIYDQTNTSFKITLQKSQSMSIIKHRKSSAIDYVGIVFGKESETVDVETFMPIQDFCTYGVSDLFKSMVETSLKKKKKKKKSHKIYETIQQRNQLLVFDYNMLDIKDEDELNTEEYLPGFNFINKTNISQQIERFFLERLKRFVLNSPQMMLKLKCFKENVGILYYDTWRMIFDLRIPYQNLLLKCFCNTEYSESVIEFTAFLLAMPFYKVQMNSNSSFGLKFYNEFTTELSNLLESCIIEDKKVMYLIVFNLKLGDNVFDKDDIIYRQIMNIFEDLNSILTGSEIFKVFPKQLIKDLIFHIKRMDLYNNLNETQLYSVITQRLISNVKFVLIFENSYFYSSVQTKHTTKSIYNILFKEYPQIFQTFKTKTIEEFLFKQPHINIKLNNSFLMKPNIPIITKVNDLSMGFELDAIKLMKTVQKNANLSNYDENYLMLVYLWELLQVKMKKKGTEEDMKIISPCLRAMIKKMEDLEKDISELKKYIEERKIETEKVNKNIEEIKSKRGFLIEEISDLTSKTLKLKHNLDGYLNEENTQKKLSVNYSEAVKTISNLQIKDYAQEISSNNYMNQKLFSFYSVLFCLLFDISLQDKNLEELPKQVKDFEGSNIAITENKIMYSFVQEFSKIIIDFNQIKEYIANYKFENVTEVRLKCLTRIIEEINIMTHYSTRYTRIQKLVLKWIDLAIENAKFNFRNDLRTKNIINLKDSILKIDEENQKRREFLHILDKETEEQPILLKKINDKLTLDQASLDQKIIIRKELRKYPNRIEIMVQKYYEKTNPIYSNEDLIKDYLLLVCVYILQISKYSSFIKKKFTAYILENCFPNVNLELYDINELLFNDTYMIDFIKSAIPMNKNLINNYAIYEFISQQDFLFPLIIDPVGLFCSCFKMKNKYGKWQIEILHKDSKTYEIIEEACEKGSKLLIKDFDSELLATIMPILVWRKERVMKKIIEIVYFNNPNIPDTGINNENDDDSKLMFNGKMMRIHSDFQLVLIVTDPCQFLSQSLLDKVIVINNELGENEIWNETLLDLIIKKCAYKEDSNKLLDQFLDGKTQNKLTVAYKKLLSILKNMNVNDLNLMILNEMKTILEEIEGKLSTEDGDQPLITSAISKEDEGPSLITITGISKEDGGQPQPVNTSAIAKKSLSHFIKDHRDSLRNSNYDHLIKKLELIRSILEQIMQVFGDIYDFSEDYYFNVINQALEVVIYNGYSSDKFESMMELFVYQLILTSFREDHQTLFSFYYSLYFLKEIGQHNKLLWNYFIQAPVTNNDNVTLFQNAKIQENWEGLTQVLQEIFKVTDANLPSLHIKNNEGISIRIKREKEERSPKKQTKIASDNRMLSSQELGSNANFITEVNIMDSSNQSSIPSIIGSPDIKQHDEHSDHLSILTRRKKRKSQTLNLNIPQLHAPLNVKEKGKKYEKKIELFSPYFVSDKMSFVDLPKISIEPLLSANKIKEIKKRSDSNFLSNIAYMLESNEEYLHKISRQFEDKITITFPDTLELNKIPLEIEKNLIPQQIKPITNSQRPKEEPNTMKKTVYFKSIATKLIISKVFEKNLKKSIKEKILISKYAWEALNKLADIIPNPFRKVMGNIELQPQIWKEILLRSSINLKDEIVKPTKETSKFAPPKLQRNFTGLPSEFNTNPKDFTGIKLPLDNLQALDVLTIIKYIRPDALEYVAKTMISKVRHSAFYYISKQNLETFSRVSNCFKPNIILFDVKKWNPTELIEVAASRNNVRLIKLCLGVSKLNEILDLVSTAAGSGSWILLENLHLVKKKNIKDILKKIMLEMEWGNNDTRFRVWFTYQVCNRNFTECNFNKKHKDYLRPLFKTCTKYFVNKNSQIQQSLYDFFQGPLNEFFTEVDIEASQKTASLSKKGNKSLYLTTISEYRQKILETTQKSDGFSLENFININKIKTNNKSERIMKFLIENKNAIRYAIYFFFSILKIREIYQNPLTSNFYHSHIYNYSEYDIQYKIDDFFNFLLKNPQNIYETFKNMFISIYDESQYNWFHSFNPMIFNAFHKDILKPIEQHKHIEINVKKINYLLLPLGRNQNKDIFEYIINTPAEDPIEAFGYNRNHEFSHNYQKSKNFFDYVVRNHFELENKLSLQKEALYLNDVTGCSGEEELNKNLKDFLEFLIESFTANNSSPLLNLINLLNKITKIIGDAIDIEKTELLMKIIENKKNDENNNNSIIDINNDISFIDDPDEKYEEFSEENGKSSSSKLIKIDKSHISSFNSSGFDVNAIKVDTISDKSVFSLNFGKSSIMLKRKRDEINENNEKNKEIAEDMIEKIEIPIKKTRPIKFTDIFRSVILNEMLIHNKILNFIKNDLISMSEFLKGNCSINMPKNLAHKLNLIKENLIPEEWWMRGSSISSTLLFDYLKTFLIKQDFLFNLIYDRKCEISPILPFSKMYDPLDALTSFLMYYARENKCSIYDLQIQLIKTNSNIIPVKQPEDCINVNGLKIKNGKMNINSGFLEEEDIREFEYALPLFSLTVIRKKNINYKLHIQEPLISLYIGSKSLDSFHFDIEEEFLRGMDDYEKDSLEITINNNNNNTNVIETRERQKSDWLLKSKETLNKKEEDKKIKSYFVRIPIINPYYKNSIGAFNVKFVFYFRSLKPQMYWMKRNTMITFD